MKRRSLALLPLALLLGAIPRAATPTIAIDASSPAGKVNPLLNGLMTEEINHAYDPGARRWRPNLIGYDGPGVYGSPSYHAITLFATHVGDEILKATGADTDVRVSVTRDSRARIIYVKLVNPGDAAAPVQLDITGATLRPAATALTLAADAHATNSIDAPRRVVPVTAGDGREAGLSLYSPGERDRGPDAPDAVIAP